MSPMHMMVEDGNGATTLENLGDAPALFDLRGARVGRRGRLGAGVSSATRCIPLVAIWESWEPRRSDRGRTNRIEGFDTASNGESTSPRTGHGP